MKNKRKGSKGGRCEKSMRRRNVTSKGRRKKENENEILERENYICGENSEEA